VESGKKKTSVYRGQRVIKGYRRVEAMLSPEASRALKRLTEDGVPVTKAIMKAIIDAAKRK